MQVQQSEPVAGMAPAVEPPAQRQKGEAGPRTHAGHPGKARGARRASSAIPSVECSGSSSGGCGGGGAVGIVPPHEPSAHGSGGASEGEVGEARALRQRTGPLLPRSGCRCVEMALQQGGGHAHWGHRVSVRVAVKRQAMQETASATSKRFKTWTVAKWRVEARGEEPFNRRQENPASPPFS